MKYDGATWRLGIEDDDWRLATDAVVLMVVSNGLAKGQVSLRTAWDELVLTSAQAKTFTALLDHVVEYGRLPQGTYPVHREGRRPC